VTYQVVCVTITSGKTRVLQVQGGFLVVHGGCRRERRPVAM